jgi:predicted Rossmann-fold nucleotide-binding protein
MANDIKSLCVYCGSSDGYVACHIAAAHELGIYLANNRINLVYGGTAIGLMGAIANAVLANGGTVTGVTTEHFHAAGMTGLHSLSSHRICIHVKPK